MALMIFDDAPDVTEQILAARFIQHAFAMFRREDDMINDLCIGGHNGLGVAGSTRSGSVIFYLYKPQVSPAAIHVLAHTGHKFHTAIGALMPGCGS
jgi:hypothetical protein